MGKSLVQLNLWELQANRATFQHQIFKMEPGPTRIKYSQWNLKTGPGRIKNLNPGIFRCRIVRDKSACLRLLFGFASVSAFVKLSQILGSQGTAELWPRFWIFGNRFKVENLRKMIFLKRSEQYQKLVLKELHFFVADSKLNWIKELHWFSAEMQGHCSKSFGQHKSNCDSGSGKLNSQWNYEQTTLIKMFHHIFIS